MEERTKSAMRSLAAVLFLAIFGAVLARPIFHAALDRGLPAPGHFMNPSGSSSVSPRMNTGHRPGKPRLLLGERYPRRCLRRVPTPRGLGSIATAWGREVQIGTVAGDEGHFRGHHPVIWSPSGRYLGYTASRNYPNIRKGFYDSQTGRRGPLLRRSLFHFAWSPTADCVAGVKRGRLFAGAPGTRGVTLVREFVREYSFSANGRFLSVSLRGGTGHVIDLRRHREWKRAPVSALDFNGPSPCTDLGRRFYYETCSPDGRFVVAMRDEIRGLETNAGPLVLGPLEGPLQRITFGPYYGLVPEWGPPGTGVLFLRYPEDRSGPVEVWFIPEGGSPRATGLDFKGAEMLGYPWDWHMNFDWSATPPTGLPF